MTKAFLKADVYMLCILNIMSIKLTNVIGAELIIQYVY